MVYNKIKELSEKVISEIENNPDLKLLNDMIRADFLYLSTERDYLSLDVNNYDFLDDNGNQGFILTFEDDGEDFKTVSWKNNEGTNHGEDITEGLLSAQRIGANAAEEYEVNYITENTHRKTISI